MEFLYWHPAIILSTLLVEYKSLIGGPGEFLYCHPYYTCMWILFKTIFANMCNFVLTTAWKTRHDGKDESLDEGLVAVAALPVWWTFKFQPDKILRGFHGGLNIESLDSCHLHFFLNGTCYEIWVGLEAKVSRTSDSNCPTQAGTIMEKEPEEYYYEFSTYATQTFRSENSCSSLAAYRELQFEILDVRSQNVSSSSSSSLSSASSVAVSECRIALRLAVDFSSIDCRSWESYVKEYGYDGSGW